jgi:hypothetical protein
MSGQNRPQRLDVHRGVGSRVARDALQRAGSLQHHEIALGQNSEIVYRSPVCSLFRKFPKESRTDANNRDAPGMPPCQAIRTIYTDDAYVSFADALLFLPSGLSEPGQFTIRRTERRVAS